MRGHSRRIHIRRDVELQNYGYTVGCAGCELARVGGPPRAHSEFCRQRIETEMARDGSLARRREEFDNRVSAGFERIVKRQASAMEGESNIEQPSGASASVNASPEAPAAVSMEVEPPAPLSSAIPPTSTPETGGSPEKRVRSDSMEREMVEEELVRTADRTSTELRQMSALTAIPYPQVHSAMIKDEAIQLLHLNNVCIDVRGDDRLNHEVGRQAILAEIRQYKPKLVITPYMQETQQEFASVVAGYQSSDGRRFAVCMLDDASLCTKKIQAPHVSQFPGLRVLHNFTRAGEELQISELSPRACAVARAAEKLLELVAIPVNSGRRNLSAQNESPVCDVHSMIFGAYTSYGLGVNGNGFKRHELLSVLHDLASERPAGADPYSTINVCVLYPGSHVKLHRDVRNRPGVSWLLSFGPYNGRGGRLWVERPRGVHPPPVGVARPPDAPDGLKGVYICAYLKWISFDASVWHAVEPVAETRCSVSCYIPLGLQHFKSGLWKQLKRQGFQSDALRTLVANDAVVSRKRPEGHPSVNAWLVGAIASETAVQPQDIGTHVDELTDWDTLPEYYMCVHDTTSGQPLDATLVARGCRQEMEFLRGLQAYEYSTVAECLAKTGKPPVAVGWVYVNKGDSSAPNVRCRLVVKETRWRSTITDPSQTWSATPPYEALRFICSLCMTPMEGEEGYVLQFIDITRAHPHCEMKRDLWIQLPREDPRSQEDGICGKLLRSLYGTRDAGQNFELLVQEVMVSRLAFKQGVWTP
eukprot:6484362-Amphidinium_carterae.1